MQHRRWLSRPAQGEVLGSENHPAFRPEAFRVYQRVPVFNQIVWGQSSHGGQGRNPPGNLTSRYHGFRGRVQSSMTLVVSRKQETIISGGSVNIEVLQHANNAMEFNSPRIRTVPSGPQRRKIKNTSPVSPSLFESSFQSVSLRHRCHRRFERCSP